MLEGFTQRFKKWQDARRCRQVEKATEKRIATLSRVLSQDVDEDVKAQAVVELTEIGWPAFFALKRAMTNPNWKVSYIARQGLNRANGVSEALEKMVRIGNFLGFNSISDFYYSEFNGHPLGQHIYVAVQTGWPNSYTGEGSDLFQWKRQSRN
jgi:hypothetical protein